MNVLAENSTAPQGHPQPGLDESRGADCCVHLNIDSLHDLVSPMNQVCSIADLILTKYQSALDDDAEVLFGFIQSSTNRLRNLLAGLRTYTQVTGSRYPLSTCNANLLLAGALASIQQRIDESHAAVTHDPLPELYCDPSQMTYAFASLVENSIKFQGEQRPEIHVSAISQGTTSIFSIRDNGIGIDPRYSDRIFGIFKRIHNDAYPGAGVGLAIVRRIVEQHGGRIWVESELGHGATFFLALPKGKRRAERPPREKRASSRRSVCLEAMERDLQA